ncbi:MAG TPA: hypothetical protein VFP72_21620 [Kineosporiaceae bacterium]|nr:hypothetical protein [Kineosporiaceae bacterium]
MSSTSGGSHDPPQNGPDALRARAEAGSDRFRTLPEPPDPDRLTTTQDVSPGPDPEGGRDADRDWMLRHGTP